MGVGTTQVPNYILVVNSGTNSSSVDGGADDLTYLWYILGFHVRRKDCSMLPMFSLFWGGALSAGEG